MCLYLCVYRYAPVSAGAGGADSKTSLHAVIDYDDDDEDEGEYQQQHHHQDGSMQVTPIQGPIFLRNGTAPVVPLFSYPQLNNGSLVQIPV